MNLLCKLALPTIALFSLPALAQFDPGLKRYHASMNMAAIAEAAGKKDSAIRYYKEALAGSSSYKPPFNILGNLLIAQRKYDEGISYLEKDALGNVETTKFEALFDAYDSVKSKPEILAFRKRYPALLAQRKARPVSRDFERLVYKMLGMDQAMRRINSARELGSDSTSDGDIRRLQAYVDTGIVRPLLMEYLRSHRYPDTDSIDADLGQAFNVIVLHQLDYSDVPGLELDSIVRQAVYDGHFPPFQYVMTLDRRHMLSTGRQLYGTYMGRRQDDTWYFSPDIDQRESVDARRAQWGMLPLKDMGKIDWRNPPMPEGYKP